MGKRSDIAKEAAAEPASSSPPAPAPTNDAAPGAPVKPSAVVASPFPRKETGLILVTAILVCMVATLAHVWMQASSSTSPGTQAGLTHWIKSNGGSIDNVVVDGDNHIFVGDAVPAGDTIMTIPMDLVINRDKMLADPVVSILAQQTDVFDDISLLAAFLLANKDDPKWAAYVATMPMVSPTPLYFTAEERALLQGSMIATMIDDIETTLDQQFAHIFPLVPNASFATYRALWSASSSRAFGLHTTDQAESVMIPFFDFATHDPRGRIEVRFDAPTNTVLMKAVDEVPAGAQVRTLFQNVSNSLLLLSYGFTLDNNDQDAACRVKFDAPDLYCDLRLSLAPQDGAAACLAALRGNEEEPALEMQSVDGEKHIWGQVQAAVRSAQSAFGTTTIAEDDALLQGALTNNERNAIRARRHDKICLEQYDHLSGLLLGALNDGQADFQAVVDKFGSWPGVSEYVSALKEVAAVAAA
ncbi:Rubisco LSMT substrate-binding domain-containing protein [Plasmodiophora brassicae]